MLKWLRYACYCVCWTPTENSNVRQRFYSYAISHCHQILSVCAINERNWMISAFKFSASIEFGDAWPWRILSNYEAYFHLRFKCQHFCRIWSRIKFIHLNRNIANCESHIKLCVYHSRILWQCISLDSFSKFMLFAAIDLSLFLKLSSLEFN